MEEEMHMKAEAGVLERVSSQVSRSCSVFGWDENSNNPSTKSNLPTYHGDKEAEGWSDNNNLDDKEMPEVIVS